MSTPENRRVLLVDDLPSIHNDFRNILAPSAATTDLDATVEHLWPQDPELQIVLCTAYSNYAWKKVLTRLDVRDRLLILKKPFDAIEIYQLANALTTKWQMTEEITMAQSMHIWQLPESHGASPTTSTMSASRGRPEQSGG